MEVGREAGRAWKNLITKPVHFAPWTSLLPPNPEP